MSWMSSRQYAPEGGFSGRTNKLVDGCYSHWIGGCWPLVEVCLGRSHSATEDSTRDSSLVSTGGFSIYNREALIRFALNCCQDISKKGGLRDRPGRYVNFNQFFRQVRCKSVNVHREADRRQSPSDAYHTCYVLAGLSSAQHSFRYTAEDCNDKWRISPYVVDVQIFDDPDRVGTLDPVYVTPQDKLAAVKKYFASKSGF